LEYVGIDLDPEVIAAARTFLKGSPRPHVDWKVGNALEAADYPATPVDFISSTGLGEFLNDEDLATFYRNVFHALAPGGTFFTSAAAKGRGSEVLLRAFELDANYRTRADVKRILAMQSWASVEITQDSVGLQTFVRARKPAWKHE
jgi:SAM-dependent methyltransferase